MMTYLPDDILTKVDRASMAVSLEARVPLLDHRVVEFAWRIPSHRLIAGGEGKRPLRAVLARHVPRALVDRPKTGFGIPVGEWLKGPLRPWAEDLLSPGALSDGLFDRAAVRRWFEEFLSGRRDAQHGLWACCSFRHGGAPMRDPARLERVLWSRYTLQIPFLAHVLVGRPASTSPEHAPGS
jgi:asparagine synthase (glutamine-hydrolysing)